MTGLNMSMVVLLAFLAPLTACPASAGPRNNGPAASQTRTSVCEPTSGCLNAQATFAGREGTYLLTLVRVANDIDAQRVRGALILRRQPPGLDSLGTAATPLYGFTNIDLRAVGAHRVGDPASKDPHTPGVLVLESVHDGQRRILLRFGSDANRRNAALFDGAYTVLDVRRIDGDGFAGIWRSGARTSRTRGYFCARRVETRKPGAGIAPRVD